ncbi:hypothetical protein [Vibrio sp. TBV020]|uniref:hypothetical protein n=1 Tax=Vibrio sp. TBV020 TaxID=3137398 RepID=UPI0038CD5B5D
MLPNNDIINQVTNLNNHIHTVHLEGFCRDLKVTRPTSVSSSKHIALFNQCLIEYFELNIGSIQVLETVAPPWPITHLALLPCDVLDRVFTLWSACIFSSDLIKYIGKNEISIIKNCLSENYEWLILPNEFKYEHPKNNLIDIKNKLFEIDNKTPITLNSLINEYFIDTFIIGVYSLSENWPHIYKDLIRLKTPKNISTINEKMIRDSYLFLEPRITQTLLICLEKVSPKWHEKFSEN